MPRAQLPSFTKVASWYSWWLNHVRSHQMHLVKLVASKSARTGNLKGRICGSVVRRRVMSCMGKCRGGLVHVPVTTPRNAWLTNVPSTHCLNPSNFISIGRRTAANRGGQDSPQVTLASFLKTEAKNNVQPCGSNLGRFSRTGGSQGFQSSAEAFGWRCLEMK